MVDTTIRVGRFWQLFVERAAELVASESAHSAAYDVLVDALHRVDPGLWLEFSANSNPRELIITAEGNRALFPLVFNVVAAAPIVGGWRIRALKPKLGFPVVTRWEDFMLTIADVVFEPMERRGSDELGLCIFIRGLDPSNVAKAHNAVLRAMDHGLGEEKLAEAVRYTEVRPLPIGKLPSEFLPLADLDRFIECRERRRTDSAQ